MKPYTETQVQCAIQAVVSGQSVRAASKFYGTPKSTIQRRIDGTPSRAVTNTSSQRLAPEQEKAFEGWILTQEALGFPLTHAIRRIAGRISEAAGADSKVGRQWVSRFIARCPSLKVHRPRRMESGRVNSATTANIRKWWPRLMVKAIKAIKPENRWNMDEAGTAAGQGSNGLAVGSANIEVVRRQDPGDREWTSFIECISAVGRAIPPLVIFKGKWVQAEWLLKKEHHFYDKWKLKSAENDGTNDETLLAWLKEVFLPNTKPADPKDYRLLFSPRWSWEPRNT